MNDLVMYGLSSKSINLPSVVRTRNGATFNPHLSRWAYREGHMTVSLDFQTLTNLAAPSMIEALQVTLVWYAENKSANHMANMFTRIRHFLDAIGEDQQTQPLSEITDIHLINYYESLSPADEWYVGALAGILKKWSELGLSGVTDAALRFLDQVRIKGNQKGAAVRTMDPLNGPFTDLERQSLENSLTNAFASGEIEQDDYLLAWLFLLLGQRPIQYALLKVCDLSLVTAKDGSTSYVLRVPRAKQRDQLHRDEFKERLITPQIGSLLVKYAKGVERQFEGILPDPSQAPMFPEKKTRGMQPDGLEFHRTGQLVGRTLVAVLDELNVTSERTGLPLHITPTRFRRTLGTRAAMEGHGELIIADLLDHTDTQNVGVYVQATPEIVERIDRAVAMQIAPMAQAFAGVLIENETEAVRGDDPTSRIVDPRFDKSMKPMGNCGRHGFCGFMAPIACYTCKSFQAWLDGPHEAVLEYLITERERLVNSADKRIASINDLTIMAIADVIQRCESIRAERQGAHVVVHG